MKLHVCCWCHSPQCSEWHHPFKPAWPFVRDAGAPVTSEPPLQHRQDKCASLKHQTLQYDYNNSAQSYVIIIAHPQSTDTKQEYTSLFDQLLFLLWRWFIQNPITLSAGK